MSNFTNGGLIISKIEKSRTSIYNAGDNCSKKRIINSLLGMVFAMLAFTNSVLSQTSTTIYSTGAALSFKTGNSTSTTRTDGNIVSTSTTQRGYAVFNLSTIPAGSTITSVTLGYTVATYGGSLTPSGWVTYGYLGDLSTVSTAATLFNNMVSGTSLATTTYGTSTGAKTTTLSTAFFATNVGSSTPVSICFTGGAGRIYTITGETGASTTTGTHAPFLTIVYTPPCSGTPTAGTVAATVNSGCTTYSSTLSLSGTSVANNLTYQWQSAPDNATWTTVTGATNNTYTASVTSTIYYRCQVRCPTSGITSNTTGQLLTLNTNSYATLPFTESFETTWINGCGTSDWANANWKGTPITGNNAWRRDDDVTSAAWGSTASGAYSPVFSAGAHSARFHSYQASSGTIGTLDLYVNLSAAGTKNISFDYINTSGTDVLSCQISTDGGSTFTTLDGPLGVASTWTTRNTSTTATTATAILRFTATSDFGTTDIGLDNISVSVAPGCTGTPTAGTVSATVTNACGLYTSALSLSGTSATSGIAFQWQSAPDSAIWTNVLGATNNAYSASITSNIYYRCNITCANSGLSAATPGVKFTTSYSVATLPYTESFESSWLSTCGTSAIPNGFWANTPQSGDNSWRRNDDVTSAVWTSSSGAYSPTFSAGAYSARFHTYDAASGTIGNLDLYINLNTPGTKNISYSYINTSGTDALKCWLSTDGGVTFSLLDAPTPIATSWTTRTTTTTATASIAILRFSATSDYGTTDIGLDNVQICIAPTAITGTTSVCNGSTTTLTDAISGGTWLSSNTLMASVGSTTGVVTGVAAGTAIITYSNGCGNAVTATVTVNPLPTAVTASGAGIFCGSTTITASNGGSGTIYYQGTTSGGTSTATASSSQVITSSGTYYFRAQSALGCWGPEGSVTVTVNPNPVAISGSNSVCQVLTTTLNDGTGSGSWSASNGNVSIGSGTGIITGITSGTAMITYALATGCNATMLFSVNPSPATIGGTLSACVSSGTTLTDATSGGVWTSSLPGVASIGSTTGVVSTGTSAGTTTISYTAAGCPAMAIYVVNGSPAGITGTTTVCSGLTTTLSNPGGVGLWTSSDNAIATVGSSTGIVTGVLAGTATINYSNGCGTPASIDITVLQSPTAIGGSAVSCAGTGTTTTLTNTITGGTWSSTNTTVATIGSTSGVLTPLLTGTTIVSYTLGNGCPAATLTEIVTTPPALITGATSMCTGSGVTLSNSILGGTWSSSAAGVASVNSTTGAVTGSTQGTAIIAYSNGCGSPATQTVTVNAAPATITGTTFLCSSTATLLSNSSTNGTWSSSTGAVATIGGLTGLVSAIAQGTSIVTYSNGCGANATKVVTVGISPATITGTLFACSGGGTTTLANTSNYGNWSSSNTSVASIGSLTGAVVGATAGTSIITYSTGCGSPATVTVAINGVPSAIAGSNIACVGASISLSDPTAGGTWSSSAPTVASIGSLTGTVNGLLAGTSTILYTTACGSASTVISVTSTAAPTVTASASPTGICLGGTSTLTGTATGGPAYSVSSITYSPISFTPTATLTGTTTPTSGTMDDGYQTVALPFDIKYFGTTITAGTSCFIGANGYVTFGAGPGTITIGAMPSTSFTQVMAIYGRDMDVRTTGSITYGVAGAAPNRIFVVSYNAVPDYGTTNYETGQVAIYETSGKIEYHITSAVAASHTFGIQNSSAASATFTIPGHNSTTTGVTNLSWAFNPVTYTYSWSPATFLNSTTIASPVASSVTSTTPYVLTATASTSCAAIGTTTVTVNAVAAVSGSTTICVGSNATLTDATGAGTWTSNNTAVATIGSTTGILTGQSAGTAVVTFTLNSTGCTQTALITVNPNPAAISGAGSLCAGLSTTFTNSTSGGFWSSNNSNSSAGLTTGVIIGVTAGTSVISYTLPSGCYATAVETINPAPASITGVTTVCQALTSTLADATSGGTWTSGNTSIATIDPSTGFTTGLLPGSSIVTYTLPTGCLTTTPFVVNVAPAPISGTISSCASGTSTLTDATSGGVWSSSLPGVATIGSLSGVVTAGLSSGTTTISYTVLTCPAITTFVVNGSPAANTGTPVVCTGFTTTLANPGGVGNWTSSNILVATIGSISGVVTGVSAGTTIVSYSNGCGTPAATIVTVNQTPSAISGLPTTCLGTPVTLTNIYSGGTWSSSNTSIASIGSLSGILTPSAQGVTIVTYNLNNGCNTATFSETVYITPASISGTNPICSGTSTTLGNTSLGGTWTSLSSSIATIGSTNGLVNGVTPGVAVIQYSTGCGSAATYTMTINGVPASITGLSQACVGVPTTLTDATLGGTWTSSATSIATIGSLTGIVNGVAAGTTTITYSVACGSTTSVINVVSGTPPSLAVTATPTSVCLGGSSSLNVTASGATPAYTVSSIGYSPVTVSGTSLIASDDGSGTVSLPFPVNLFGTSYSTAYACANGFVSFGSATTGSNFTAVSLPSANAPVSAAAQAMVALFWHDMNSSTVGTITSGTFGTSPNRTFIISYNGVADYSGTGTNTGEVIFYESANYIDVLITNTGNGNTYNKTCGIQNAAGTSGINAPGENGVSYSATNQAWRFTPAIYTYNWSPSTFLSNTTISSPVASGVSATTVYSVTVNSSTSCAATSTTTVTMNPVLPNSGTATVCANYNTPFTNATGAGTWSSSNPSVATIGSTSGILTGIAAGSATITFTLTSTGCTATTLVSVTPLPAAITGTLSACTGATSSLSDATFGGTWSSSTTVATVDASGLVTAGVSAGTTTISYIVNSCPSLAVFAVNGAPGSTTGPTIVCSGNNITLSNSGGVGNWTSSNTAVAAVGSTNGVVTGVFAGTSTINYTNGCGSPASYTISVLQTPSAITGAGNVCTSSTLALTNLFAGGVWTSSAPSVATIGSSTGVVNGVSAGSATITYDMQNGCSTATYVQTVYATPGANTGASNLCAGSTTTLNNTTAGGYWSSGSTSVATVGSTTGLVTSITSGTTVITYSNGCGTAATTLVSVNSTPAAISGNSIVCIGTSTTLTDITPGGTWSSSSAAIATVGSLTGLATGVTAGSVNITFTNSCGTAVFPLSVSNLPPVVTASASPSGVCLGGSSSLLASATGAPPYSVTSIPYSPASIPTASLTPTDDGSGTVTIPFSFSLFGTSYTTAYVCANGFISFGSATTSGNYTAVSLPSTSAPVSATPQAMIGLFWHDMNSSTVGNITTGTFGTTPNRTFVISYNGVADYSGTGTNTGQVILYETLNMIDAIITNTGDGTSYVKTCGIQNAAGTIGINAPGENGIAYSATNTAFRFAPVTYSYLWSPSTILSSSTISNPTASPVTATTVFTVTATASSSCAASTTTTVTMNAVNPISGTTTICSGSTSTLTNSTGAGTWLSNATGVATIGSTSGLVTAGAPGTAMITFTLTSTGCTATTMVSVNPLPTAVSVTGAGTYCGTGPTITASNGSSGTIYYQGTTSGGTSTAVPSTSQLISSTGTYYFRAQFPSGCWGPQGSAAVTVNPVPSVSSANNDGPVCAGTTVNLSVTGATNVTGYLWNGPVAITSSTSAAASIPSASTGATGVYTLTVNNGAGTGCTATYNTSVTVSPFPSLTSASNDGPICAGTTLGLSVTGASNVTGYLWSGPVSITGATSASASVPSATTAANGTYTVTVNNGTGRGCSTSYTTAATVSPFPSLTSANNDGPICVGATLNLSVTGASNVTGYSWAGPVAITSATSATASVPSATTAANGTYTVTINNGTGRGCTTAYTTNATINTIAVAPTNDGPACVGGTINLASVESGTAPGVTYAWSGPSGYTSTNANPILSSLTTGMAGTYTVTASNTSSGCSATGTTNVTVNTIAVAPTNDGPACVGGTINLSSVETGSAPSVTYSWSGPSGYTSTNANPILGSLSTGMAGTYTLTASNTSSGCSATGTTNVTVNTIAVAPTNDGPACVGGTINLSSVETGSAPSVTYAWSGPAGYSSTSVNPVLSSLTTGMAGTYTVTASNTSSGCSATSTTNVIVNTIAVAPTNNGSACVGGSITLSSVETGSAPSVTYLWNGPSGYTSTSVNPVLASLTTGMAGTYTVTASNSSSGCNATGTTDVTVHTIAVAPTNDGPACVGGSITLSSVETGSAPSVTYLWNGPSGYTSTSVNPVLASLTTGMAGTYTVTASNSSSGCSATGTTDVTVHTIAVAPTNDGPACVGGTINLGSVETGTAPSVTYAWSGPAGYTSTSANPVLSSLTTGMAGAYTVTASNISSGCSATGTTNVTVNTIAVAPTNNGPACVGGSITLSSVETGTAPSVTYVWSGPSGYSSANANPVLSSLTTGMAGTYTVTASNASSGCSATGTTDVTVNTIAVAPTNNGPACVGGTITLSSVETGSAPSVTYVWNGPAGYTSTNVNPVLGSLTTGMAGAYTVTASNGASGCSATGTTNITVNTIAVAPTNNGPACVGGTITLSSVETGTAPSVTYAWSGPAGYTSTSINPVLSSLTTGMAGAYTVTASNTSSGCSATGTTNVTVNTIAVAPTNNGPACAGGSITLSSVATGTAPSVVYSWSGPLSYTSTSANPTISSLLTIMSGVYSVTASNSASGCSATGTTNVTVNPGPTTAPTNDGPACVGGTLNLDAHGVATGTPSYAWVGPNGFTSTSASPSISTVSLLAGGTYSVSISTVGSACSSTNTTTVLIKPAPSLTGVSNNGPLCAGNTLNLSSGTASSVTDYSWVGPNAFASTLANPSITTPTATATGIYSVTVINGAGSGCTAIYTTSATVNRLPNPVTVSGGGTFCNGTTITAANGADGTIYYQGTTSGGTSMAIPATSRTVSVTGTYYFRALLPSGCWGPEGSVSVLIPAITGSPAVCIGLTVNFSCTGGAGTWSSSNPTFASVGSATGIVTGVGTGTATISYNMTSGCLVKSNIYSSTVAPPISGPGRVCVGQSITLTEPIPGGTWSSSIPTAAAAGVTTGIITGMASGFIPTITYTLGPSCKAMATVTVSALSIITGPSSVCQGRTITLRDATTGGTWVSNNTSIATVVSTSGVVSGVAGGTATISYVLPTGCVATMDVPVGPLSPIIGPSSVCVGQTITMSDLDAGGTWTSSAPTVASIGSTGIVTGLAGNLTATISYSFSTGCRATQTVSVNALTANAGPAGVCLGQTITLTNGTTGGSWSSSNAAIASVGSTGIVTGAAVGTAIITYSTPGGCAATSVVTVSLINPIVGSSSVCQGQTTTFTNASAGGVWSSAAPTVASIGSTGIVNGIAPGLSTTISYTLGTGCRVTKSITVNAIAAITGLSNVCQGSTIALANATPSGSWTSSAATVASVGSTGVVTGVGFGTTIISYTVPTGCRATKVIISGQADPISGPSIVCVSQSITMTETIPGGVWSSSAPTVAKVGSGTGVVTGVAGNLSATISYTLASGCRSIKVVSVNPAAPITSRSLYACVGQSITMSNTVLGGTWSSSTPATGTIDPITGILVGISAGTAVISYSLNSSCVVTGSVAVNPLAPTTGPTTVCVGQTMTLTNSLSGGSWHSVTPTVASVGLTSGVVTGAASGAAVISYTMTSGCNTLFTVSVNALAAILGRNSVCVGQTTTLTDAAAGGRWSSGTTGVATIGTGSGIVNGITTGTSTISYVMPTGCTSTFTMLVNALSGITGPTTVCVGQTITLTDGVAGGTWASSAPTVASVGSTGIVTGMGTSGSRTIISYTLVSGCRDTATITINPTVTVAAITGAASASVSGAPIILADATAGGLWSNSNAVIASVGSLSGSVKGLSVGTVIITYRVTNSSGCFATATKPVTIGPAPLPQVSTGVASTICIGAEVALNATVKGGVWYSDNSNIANVNAETGVVTGNAAGRATVSYTIADNNGTSVWINPIIVNPLPDEVIIKANPGTTIMPGQKLTLTAGVSNGGSLPVYQWLINGNPIPGANSYSYSSNTFKDYDVVTCIVGSSSGCGNHSVSNKVLINVGTTGVNQTVHKGFDVRIVPNPNIGEFVIKGALNSNQAVSAVDEKVSLEITNMLGQVIYHATINAHNGVINESIILDNSLANGMYILNLHNGNQNDVFNFVIEK